MSCVYCGSSDNLNTTFTITIDEEKIKVIICDEHAEDASVKTAKEAYVKKQKEIDSFLAQAKALGLNITINNGSQLAVATSGAPVQQQVRQAPQQPIYNEPLMEGTDVVNTEMLNSRNMKSIGGRTEYGMVNSYDSLDNSMLTEKIDPNFFRGKAKMGMVEGRGGQPLAIQEVRVDGTGTTRIQISKKEDDQKLQNRFKRMADDSRNDRTPDFARNGYENTMRNCPLCRGEATIVNNNATMICPKCNGLGNISIY